MPAVDAIVVSWESAALLPGCLAALQGQAGVELRVIVVDNGSTDGSADLVERDHAGVTLVRQRQNFGYTQATNQGLKHVAAPYVLFCNPDCLPEPGAVARLVAFLQSNPSADAVAPRLIGPDGEVQDFCYRFPTLVIAAACYTETGRRLDQRLGGRAEARRSRHDLHDAAGPVAVDHAGAACLLLCRDALSDGLAETMPLYFSDLDLSFRIRANHRHVYLEPAATARHQQGGSIQQLPWRLLRHELQRGLRAFYRRHHGPARRAALTTIMIVDGVTRAAVHALRDRSLAASREEIDWLGKLLSDQPGPGTPWVTNPPPTGSRL
jgi:GT2 family glycosyltransferase